jgi:hypothetical protein
LPHAIEVAFYAMQAFALVIQQSGEARIELAGGEGDVTQDAEHERRDIDGSDPHFFLSPDRNEPAARR